MSYKIIDLPALGRPFNATDIIEVSANGTGSFKANIGDFTLGGENYIFVNSNGTPAQNGQAVRDAYTAAQAMTPNSNPIAYNNKVIILLAPGYYSFNEAVDGPFLVDQNFIDLESLTGSRDVFFSSIQVDSSSPGIIVNISGIDTTKNNYYPHAAFAVASSAGIDEFLTIQNCKGGDYSFSSFSSGFSGIYNNCEAGNFSFCSIGDAITPPDGILSTAIGTFNNYGNITNCKAEIFSFVSGISVPAGSLVTVSNYGYIKNCTADFNSFCYSEFRVENLGVIDSCEGGDYSFCACNDASAFLFGFSLNSGRIINCTSIGSGFCVYAGSGSFASAAENTGLISNCNSSGLGFAIIDGLSIGDNSGQILNCYVDEEGFCGSGGENAGIIIECTAQYTSFCNQNSAGISGPILKCTLLGDVFIVGTPPFGGRVVLGIDNTGVVNY